MSDAPRWPGSDGGPGLDFSPHRTDPAEGSSADSSDDDTQVHSPISAVSPAGVDVAPDAASDHDTQALNPISAQSPAGVGAAGAGADHDTQVHSPVSPRTPAGVDGEARHAGEQEGLYRPASPTEEPGSTGSDDERMSREQAEEARGVSPVAPRVAERAARTAQEWASMPVGPARQPGPYMAPPGGDAAGTAAGGAGGSAFGTGASAVGAGGAALGAGAAAAGAGGAAFGAGATAVGAGALAGSAAQRSAPSYPLGARSARPPEDVDPLPLNEVADPKPGAAGTPAVTMRRPRRTRKARLRLARVDPWSVMKTTFLFAIAFGIMLVVATFVLWSVLAGAGTLEYVNNLLNQLFGDQDTEFDVTQILSVNRILGFSAIVSAVNVVIITALATLFAFLYNLAATVMGGLEVTLAED